MALSVTYNSVTFSALEQRRAAAHTIVLPDPHDALIERPLGESKDRFGLHPSAERVNYLEASIYLELKALSASPLRSELGRLLHMGAKIDAFELIHSGIDQISNDPKRAWEDGPFRDQVRLETISEALNEWILLDQQVTREKQAFLSSARKAQIEPLLALGREIANAICVKKNIPSETNLEPSIYRAQFGSPMWGNKELGMRLDPPHDGSGHGPGGDRLHLDIQCGGKKFRVFHCANGCLAIFNPQTQIVHMIDLSNPRMRNLTILAGNDDGLIFMGGKGAIERVGAKAFHG